MNIDINLILNKIESLENNNLTSRKATMNDFSNDFSNNSQNNSQNNINKFKMKDFKIKDYRMQEEYGEKKFIKP